MALSNVTLTELHAAVEQGGCPSHLVNALANGLSDLNECEVLDFKKTLPTNDAEYIKTVRDIVALHNSYGGFIVFGVEEVDRDRAFEIAGVGDEVLLKAKLRDLIRAYVGFDIRIDVNKVVVGKVPLELVWICKRSVGELPIRFNRNGPEDKPGRLIFKKDDVVFRRLDNNAVAAAAADYDFLYSERRPPSLILDLASEPRKEPLEHNLPDRTEICANFVGRNDDQADLWKWLSDDFSRVRLIAGEGGLGKTSLAYKFAEIIASRRIKSFNKVIWLSAKEKQFVAAQDKYRDANRVDFSDANSLFGAIAISLGETSEDCLGKDTQELMRMALKCCEFLPSFLVIDDVDSLSKDDQLRALEFGMRAPVGMKILLTTRVNFSYAPDNVLKLNGLPREEFRDFINVLRLRYKLIELADTKIEWIRQEIGGSPLFADSILRLERRGMQIEQALSHWKGEKGLEVRKAALEREIQQLSRHARRILFVVSTLRSCSYIELAQVVEYTEQTLGDSLQELSGLFLINAPSIAKEARFTIEPTTRLLVLELAPSLGIDHSALVRSIKSSKSDAIGLTLQKRSSTVALAISLANAMVRDDDTKGALDAVTSASKSLKQPHPDLLLAVGRFSLLLNPPNFEDARKSFENAYTLGQRKSMLFDLWFDTEYRRGALDAAKDVATLVIDGGQSDGSRWFEMRAQVQVALARRADSQFSNVTALRELDSAISDLREAKKRDSSSVTKGRIEQMLVQVQSFRVSVLRGGAGRKLR